MSYNLFGEGAVHVLNNDRHLTDADHLGTDFDGCASNVFIAYCNVAFQNSILLRVTLIRCIVDSSLVGFFFSLNPYTDVGCFRHKQCKFDSDNSSLPYGFWILILNIHNIIFRLINTRFSILQIWLHMPCTVPSHEFWYT